MALWVIFDLDDTLIRNTPNTVGAVTSDGNTTPYDDVDLSLYADTMRILHFLHDRGVPITLASFRTNAEEVLRDFDMLRYFSALQYGQDRRTKLDMIHNLAEELGFNHLEAIFFDDREDNIQLTSQAFIHSVLVSPRTGVTLEQVFNAISASRNPVLYVMTDLELNEEELQAYFHDYRLSFIRGTHSLQQVRGVLLYTQELILRISDGQLELFTIDDQYQIIVKANDLYDGLDELFGQLEQLQSGL